MSLFFTGCIIFLSKEDISRTVPGPKTESEIFTKREGFGKKKSLLKIQGWIVTLRKDKKDIQIKLAEGREK